jgi:GTP-binding protein Era
MISASNGDRTGDLAESLAAAMPESPFLYPEDQIADLSERLLAAEITREKLYLRVHDELPYALTVETESWKALKDGAIRIEQTIYVAREGHKPIILGKNGQTVKWVGKAAREELEVELGCRVHLFLFVKIRPNWGEDRARFSALGLDFDA